MLAKGKRTIAPSPCFNDYSEDKELDSQKKELLQETSEFIKRRQESLSNKIKLLNEAPTEVKILKFETQPNL
jgi:hypothetical protein